MTVETTAMNYLKTVHPAIQRPISSAKTIVVYPNSGRATFPMIAVMVVTNWKKSARAFIGNVPSLNSNALTQNVSAPGGVAITKMTVAIIQMKWAVVASSARMVSWQGFSRSIVMYQFCDFRNVPMCKWSLYRRLLPLRWRPGL